MADFWFNRMTEHWVLPQRLDLVEYVRRARLQVVQAGTFGPMFYGLADDDTVDRGWVGMPLVGIEENLALAAELIPRVQAAGAKVVGQLSLGWIYGDHQSGKGLFGVWERLWTEALLGPAPVARVEDTLQRNVDGSLRSWPIEGRPYQTYSGCMCNPHWLTVLQAMVRKAIGLGVEGFNAHHNFEQFCQCDYCKGYLDQCLEEAFSRAELDQLLDPAGPGPSAEYKKPLALRPDAPQALRQRCERMFERAVYRRRKEFFDALFIEYGRSLEPGLLLAQWYHKYDLSPWDERCLLPAESWGRDESYIWYSQGPNKGFSSIEHGHLADLGLPARYAYAMSGGKSMVLNKYDSRRWRLSIAEAGANHSAALAFHWGQDADEDFALEDYLGPVVRYQRFLAESEALIHPARPWSQLGLVYPRRAELEGENDCLEPLKQLGRFLEDDHVLFDILLDEHLLERGRDYPVLLLPGINRLTLEEGDFLRAYVAAGGKLVFSGETGSLALDGVPHTEGVLADWQRDAPAGVVYIEERDWGPREVEVRPGATVQVYPVAQKDAFGRDFLARLGPLLEPVWLETDAPWFVRVRAWQPEKGDRMVLHWVNYHQDESSDIEVAKPVGPFRVSCVVPEGKRVERVEWRYPEQKEALVLPHQSEGRKVQFEIDTLIVYGLSVLYFAE